MASILSSVRNKRSVSPVVQRLLELCVHYQQQQQDNQNHASSSNANVQEMNKIAEKKIKALVKQVNKSKKQGSIEELENAILHKDPRTRCITIPNSSNATEDGSSRSNPVVEYCRLWRWRNLTNQNELKPVDYCPNAVHYGQPNICVNPYHYERVPTSYSVYVPILPPYAMPSLTDIRSESMKDNIPPQIPQNTTYEAPFQQIPVSPSLSPESIASQDSYLSPCDTMNSEDNAQQMATPMDLDDITPVPSNPSQEPNRIGERVPFEEPHEWCHISYYEMSTRVGEQYRASQSQVIIDGFTDPSSAERFCLGGLTNVHRTTEIDKARRYIGRGVKLFHIRGSVFAECLSANPVFVQSPITNKRLSWHPATVCKIPPNVRLKIFDSDDFTQVLASAVNEGYKSVYQLMRMCIIRMSFVKGWGVDYGRQTVTCTPCWIEIHLDGPLKWLDSVLSTMRGPTDSITSVS
ncbi:unnamed protein product [Adineta ricciae]|uniref:Mothers against decapentaplegic homolog n=1 Tax=Adineta ricciae TaxID=249248 RepID=A0A814DHB3_ADIRI|nr:unnamed protein product [Adineta ricciae]CAF1386809.1 unnamed protein product [Adineta ricciae]